MPKDSTAARVREPKTITITDLELYDIIVKITSEQDYYGHPDMFRVPPLASRQAMANAVIAYAQERDTNVLHEQARRKRISDELSYAMSHLLYYDRKEDESLPVGAIEEALREGVITIDEMVDQVRQALMGAIKP